ncbi:hypothetical protein IW140_000645 [Coemansia sp. RSA 1813]|nr:hypothetical protein EV178_003349 [Coemansia sp. RSA 1646]KAJ1774113.1 hypothetical protein LPJ74_000212 [Coemansia sp. RSA 1843]KAJ2216810.1 hypothetical protein EV179_001100 [Coemansia sp. RSA 487]KAJ2572882.1 hypothetical protein IW140_000645 [Coemansia sp. RSA 1813]
MVFTNAKLFLCTAFLVQSLTCHVALAAPAATDGLITLDMLNAAVPGANSTDSCKKLPAEDKWPEECVDNTVALVSINKALAKYNITRRADIIAILSWMVFETASWKYYRNHFPEPGKPGQGTRTMMSWDFVSKYAKSLYPCKYGIAIGDNAANASVATDAQKTNVLDLVTNNDDAFAAGFWFLVNQSGSYYIDETLKDGDNSTFIEFNKEILYVGDADMDERVAVWDTVKEGIKF